MRICVITGGPNISDASAAIAMECDSIICADSGADFAIRHNLPIAKVMGDLDSISEEGKSILSSRQIPVELFPVEKDMTDTELALRSIALDDEIVLICSLMGRIDHVTANVNLVSKLRQEGRKITATDGVTDIIPLAGNDSILLSGLADSDKLAVSLIPMCENVKGVTTDGLYYRLENADLTWGSTFSNSNKMSPDSKQLGVSIKEGKLIVILTYNT